MRTRVGAMTAVVMLAGALSVMAQAPAPTRTAHQAAPIDLTGYWVSVVTEDWRYRMITPPKGDYARVPLTPAGKQAADAWDPATDEAAGNQCRAYGAAGLMRVPGRFHITWQDEDTLRIDADAGTQTRELGFKDTPRPAERSWQGNSIARWEAAGRSLSVVTTNMRSGYLRRNGVPYSENTTLTEHFDVAPLGNDQEALVITTIVDDPQYLLRPFVVTTHLKKESNGAKWNPTPCSARW